VTPSLTGRHAVVTGGGRGIGLAIARGLLGHGATVTLLSRGRARLEKSAATLAGQVMIEVADVASPPQIADAFVDFGEMTATWSGIGFLYLKPDQRCARRSSRRGRRRARLCASRAAC